MSLGEFIAALAANLIVAGVVSYLKGPSLGAICLSAGFVLMIVAYLVRKKPSSPPAIEQGKLRLEELVVEFMRKTHPTYDYRTEEVANALNLKMHEAREVLERLVAKHRVLLFKLNETLDGKAWLLENIERVS
jgi:hypothetical protein